MENSMLKWHEHVVCMEDKRWPKRKMTWSPGGRRRGWSDVEQEKEVEGVMTQRNLTSDGAINRQLWQVKTSNRWTTGKLTDRKSYVTLLSVFYPYPCISCARSFSPILISSRRQGSHQFVNPCLARTRVHAPRYSSDSEQDWSSYRKHFSTRPTRSEICYQRI
jgi:hypothetical protein